ncbi:MAG: hypothetical protein HY231_23835 [Acidobacteria bacterium]|nr:hypothetical protein [Acidobacteriota bacterium]
MPTNTYEIIGRFRADNILLGFTKISDAAKRLEDRAKANQRAWQNQTTAFSRFYANYSRMAGAGREISGIWQHQVHSLEKYHEAAMKVAAVQQRLYTLNLKPEENQKAMKGIEDVVKNLRGMRIDEVTENFLDLHSALGSVDHALDLLGDASKYRFNMKALFGEKFSSEQIDQQILSSFKFLEQTGVMRATGAMGADGKKLFTEADKHRAQEYFDVISKITAATAGRITGTELQQLAGRGGMSLMGLTPEGLKNLVFIMQEMGGSATGTSLSSAFQKFVGGTMKQSSMKELQALGLLDLKKVEFNKSGIPKHIQPGAIPIADLLQKDPLAFADAMAKAMKEKKGIDPNNVDQVTKELANIVGGQGKTTGNLLAKLIIMRDVVRKDAEIVSNAKGVNEQYAQSLTSIAGKIEELKAARENFRASVGQGLLGIEGSLMRNLQPVIKGLSDFFLLHPQAARMAAEILLLSKGLSAMAKTAAVLRMAGMFGSAGNRGAAGITALQQAAVLGGNPAAVSSAARTTGIGIGGGLAGGIAAGLGAGIALFAIGEAIQVHLASVADLQDAKSAGLELGKSIKDGLLEELKAGTEEAKREIRKIRAPQEAKLRVKNLQIDRGIGELDNTRVPEFMSALASLTFGADKSYEKGYGYSPKYGEGATRAFIAEELKKQQFRSAEDIAAFLKEARESLTKGGSGELYGTLEEMVKRLYPGMTEVAQMQMRAEEKLAEAAQGASGALDTFSGKLNLFTPSTGQPEKPGLFPKKEFNLKPRPFATGGIVMRPINALIGERGPEAVIPLHRMQAMMAGRSSAGDFQLHVHNHISGDVSAETIAKVEAATRRAVLDSKREILSAINEEYRDRQLAS